MVIQWTQRKYKSQFFESLWFENSIYKIEMTTVMVYIWCVTGDRTIELKFAQAPREKVSAMVYSEYDDLLRIDNTRTVEIAS